MCVPSGMLDPSIPSDWLILTVFVNSWASSITERNAIWWWCPMHLAEFELATNTALSDFPNVEAKREEQRNCFKTPSRQDRCVHNFTDWLWKKSYFPAFSSNKACVGIWTTEDWSIRDVIFQEEQIKYRFRFLCYCRPDQLSNIETVLEFWYI